MTWSFFWPTRTDSEPLRTPRRGVTFLCTASSKTNQKRGTSPPLLIGLPERIRTVDLQSRSLTRYPAVPRVDVFREYQYSTKFNLLQVLCDKNPGNGSIFAVFCCYISFNYHFLKENAKSVLIFVEKYIILILICVPRTQNNRRFI